MGGWGGGLPLPRESDCFSPLLWPETLLPEKRVANFHPPPPDRSAAVWDTAIKILHAAGTQAPRGIAFVKFTRTSTALRAMEEVNEAVRPPHPPPVEAVFCRRCVP